MRGELGLLREGRLAILCRTNLEVLQIGSELRGAGIDVRVQHRAEDRGAGPWLAEVFGGVRTMSARVGEAIAQADTTRFPAPDDAAVRLRRAGAAQGDSVNLTQLADSIRYGNCPESLTATHDALVTISTIHRAKGLEFDVVLVVDSGRGPDDDFLDEAKVLFVAYSRARRALLACGPVDFEGRRGTDRRSGRGTVRAWAKRARVSEVEVRVSDSDPDWVPEDRGEYAATQERIRGAYEAGDGIELVLNGSARRDPGVRCRPCSCRQGIDESGRHNTSVWGGHPSHLWREPPCASPRTDSRGSRYGFNAGARGGIGRAASARPSLASEILRTREGSRP